MSENPFLISGPAIISFSGGRTSGKMLYEIVQAHGGVLPDDVKVCFANTGKEREETLRFVYECGVHWNVHIHWLEWCDGKPCFEEVGFNSASREGEPFQALIAKKKRLPNWMERWCTQFLKVYVLTGFAKAQGWLPGHYNEIIGLRHDEGHRILKAIAMGEKDKRCRIYPLSRARITLEDVTAFWAAQPFDLELEPWEIFTAFVTLVSKFLEYSQFSQNLFKSLKELMSHPFISLSLVIMEEFSWLLVVPGAVFSLTLFSLNFLGDGLRDALDVRASKD